MQARNPATSGRSAATRLAAATFAVGFVAIAAAVALVLTQAPPRLLRIGYPGVKAIGPTGATLRGEGAGSFTLCQVGESLPAGASAIRVSLWGFYGAPVHVAAFKDGRPLTQGRRDAAWTSDSVTVPVRPVARPSSEVKLCVALGPNSQPIMVLGPPERGLQSAVLSESIAPSANITARHRRALGGRVVVEYLASGRRSWWSRLTAVAHHLGLGRTLSGSWIALLVAAMMAAACALAVRLALRELR